MQATHTGPLFIVGASRSGTALARSCLNAHSRVHVAGETHYFDDLRPALQGRERAPLTAAEAARCQDYFLALAHRPYGHQGRPEESPLDRAALSAAADQLGHGADSYFEAFCRMEAQKEGKPRWGEKTPRHVFRIGEILERYPDAQVLCMVRDPRAVVASYRSWRNQGGFDLERDPDHAASLDEEQQRASASYHIVLSSLLWRSTVGAATQARRRFGERHVLVLRYEALVADPEPTLRRLAGWLGLEFEPAMLDVPVHNSSFAEFQARGGFSRDAVARWRQQLTPAEIGVVESCCAGLMAAHGYQREPLRASSLAVARAWATLPAAVAKAASANRGRIANLPAYVWRRLSTAGLH